MAFPAELLRSGIAIADNLTKGVQSNIVHSAFTGSDASGNESYAAPVVRQCVVDFTNRQVIEGGQVLNVSATLTFVGDVAPNGSVTVPARREPFDIRDKIALPDGTIGTIIKTPNAVNDPSTNRGFIHEVWIGARS